MVAKVLAFSAEVGIGSFAPSVDLWISCKGNGGENTYATLCKNYAVRFKGLKQVVKRHYSDSSPPEECFNVDGSSEDFASVNAALMFS